MVSPIQSLTSQISPAPNPLENLGRNLSTIRGQNLQNQLTQQRMGQEQAVFQQQQKQLSQQEGLQRAQFFNRLGKSMLAVDESQWPNLIRPHTGVLQQMGLDPSKLDNLTRQDIEAVVAQTAAVMPADLETRRLDIRERELEQRRELKEMEPELAGQKEREKLIAQKGLKAVVQAEIKLAEQQATERGETLTDLNRARAALPGIKDVVNQLRELAPIASSTLGEKAFDVAAKEAGFGATKGATARAKFIAIIDNQILPLLKQTFGAAFTLQEGERLRATLGNPDSSPGEKMAQLDAFIDGKMREIESKERELGGSMFSGALGRNVSEQDIQDTMSANPGVTREQILQRLQIQ